MDSNLIVQASKSSHVNTLPKLMREGESALVRVLSDKGGGRYEGLVSGVKVSFSSSRPLTAGSSFVATVKLSGNTIVLVPKEAGALAANTGFNEGAIIQGMDLSKLSAWLGELGLPADGISTALLQISKQMEMRIDSSLLTKIRSLVLRFGSKGRLAAELALLLSEKGISFDEEALQALLAFLEGGNEGKEETSFEQGKKLLNKANSSEGSWFIFPFNLVEGTLGEEAKLVMGRGSIRFLLGKNHKTKLVNLFCNYKDSDYYFSLDFSKGICKKIRMNVQKPHLEKEELLNQLRSKVGKYCSGIELVWCEKAELEGSASASEDFYSLGGYV
ncbi:MAG: hypothetical protein K5681_08935 [Treponema sp.]|nr:hypothetical protein [Treponema sp.]